MATSVHLAAAQSLTSFVKLPGFVGIREEQRPTFREHKARPGFHYLRNGHSGDDQGGVESCIDDVRVVGHAGQYDAGAAGLRGQGNIDDIEPAAPQSRGQSS